jgi:hypothetical protein
LRIAPRRIRSFTGRSRGISTTSFLHPEG